MEADDRNLYIGKILLLCFSYCCKYEFCNVMYVFL